MSVEGWARREAEEFNDAAEKDFSRGVESAFGVDEDSFSMGVVHAFDALLSDEAVEAGAQALDANFNPDKYPIMAAMFRDYAATALQAAVRAVTDPKTHDSSTTTRGEQ